VERMQQDLLQTNRSGTIVEDGNDAKILRDGTQVDRAISEEIHDGDTEVDRTAVLYFCSDHLYCSKTIPAVDYRYCSETLDFCDRRQFVAVLWILNSADDTFPAVRLILQWTTILQRCFGYLY